MNCTAGRHRSVAVAERLARDLRGRRWERVRVEVEHTDTDVEREVRRARIGRQAASHPRSYTSRPPRANTRGTRPPGYVAGR